MKFIYGKQDLPDLLRAQETCWLLTNGLGGYASTSAAFSVTRCDQGILVSAEKAPTQRSTLVHRLSERLTLGQVSLPLSSQEFADGTPAEEGWRQLSSFVWDEAPCWVYELQGLWLQRRLTMGFEENRTCVEYLIENASKTACTLQITPLFLCCPKGMARKTQEPFRLEGERVSNGSTSVYLKTNGCLREAPLRWETLFYRDDVKDGREEQGLAAACCTVELAVQPGETKVLKLEFSDKPITGEMQARPHRKSPFRDEAAKELARAAQDFITRRDSTGGKTIVAGYPFFGDWGRDTMIALPGCALATEQYDVAKSILRTFLAYEQDGLVPNLFPEGDEAPRYNTVDAALLLINTIWLYHEKTRDTAFVREAWPVMERIVSSYRRGTHHGIGMDADGLIHAGEGLDQVTWMDVCVDGILPTPRHGKPVEINAYWYNALRILEAFSPMMGQDGHEYANLAQRVKTSFLEKFWMEDHLKDVLSGTAADTQLRCNQIWAVTLPFTMLSPEQERQVVETVYRELYTPCGLRTLSPRDPEFHPTYGGAQKQRDLAYHQGTVWVFPLGAYYRAYLKVHGCSREAAARVRQQLEAIVPMLREGCVGQLPEIYDGLQPGGSQGCFAQAWSVGELLSVYQILEEIDHAG